MQGSCVSCATNHGERDMISMDTRLKMMEHGYTNIKIISILSPAWTTDWMTVDGKRKLID